jgi:hypothetical protein
MHGTSLLTFEYIGDREAFWNDYVERVGWGVRSEDVYQNFIDYAEEYLGELFDTWSNPNEDDVRQHDAYVEFWAILAGYGLDQESFDWHTFKEQYPSTD